MRHTFARINDTSADPSLMNTLQPGQLHVSLCEHEAHRLLALFDGTYDRWEFAGTVRRGCHGHTLDHVIIPRLAPHMGQDGQVRPLSNLVWRRVEEIARRAREITRCVLPIESIDDQETLALSLMMHPGQGRPHRHNLYLATRLNWGMQLARHTGPEGYWRILLRRLEAAGTLRLHQNQVCHVQRTPSSVELVPIEVPDEREFFKLARTRYVEPRFRFSPSPHMNPLRGMTREYLPEFLLPYADPGREPHLFRFTESKLSQSRRRQRAPHF